MVDLHRSGAHRVPLWSGGPGVGTSHAGQPKLPRTADFGSILWHIYKASYKQALLKCFFPPISDSVISAFKGLYKVSYHH